MEKLNADIETLLRDDKDYWEGERGVEPMSKAAFESVLTSARVTRLVAGGVSHLRVAKDVTEEAFRSDDGRLGYFGQHAGPGPVVSRAVVRAMYNGDGADEDQTAENQGFGAFFDY